MDENIPSRVGINLNHICYCGTKLLKDTWDYAAPYNCLCCCQLILACLEHRTLYRCKQGDQCIYKTIQAQHFQYGVCPDCYNGVNDLDVLQIKNDGTNEENSLLYQKCNHTLNILS